MIVAETQRAPRGAEAATPPVSFLFFVLRPPARRQPFRCYARPVFEAAPEGPGPHPLVVVCFEVWGLTEHIRAVCRRFAAAGFRAVAPDFYHRHPEPRAAAYGDWERAFALANSITDDRIVEDVHDAIGPQRAGIVGYCMGGRTAFLAACRLPQISACVAYYGVSIGSRSRFAGQVAVPLDEAAGMKAALLMHYGGRDEHAPRDEVDRVTARLRELGRPPCVVIHPRAGHAFANDERPDCHHADSARTAWLQTVAFLQDHLA